MDFTFKKNKKYGYYEVEDDKGIPIKGERDKKVRDYILKELGEHYEYKCVKKGLVNIIIDSGLEASIRNDGEYRKCYYCDGLNVICRHYEPLIYLINIKKREDKNEQ